MTMTQLALRNLQQQITGANRRAALVATTLFLLLLAGMFVVEGWYQDQLLYEKRIETGVEVRARSIGLGTVVNSQLSYLDGLAGYVLSATDEAALASGFAPYAAALPGISGSMRALVLAPDGASARAYAPGGDRSLQGLDLSRYSEPEVRAAVEQARGSEEPVLAGPLQLDEGELVLVGARAVFREGEIWGLALVMLDVSQLLEEVGMSSNTGTLELAIRDERARVFMGDYTLFARDPALAEVAIADERWTVAGIPNGGWAAAIRGELLLARAAGLLLSTLVAAVVYLTVDRQGRLARAVAWRTRELAEERALLEQRVDERTRELQTLLDVSRDVASTLDFPSLLSILLDRMQEIVDFDGLALYLYQNGERLELAHRYGALPQGETALARAYRQQPDPAGAGNLREPLIIPDVHSSLAEVEQWRKTIGELPVESPVEPASWMAAPLQLENRPLGVLIFYHGMPNHYTRSHAQLALAMANHVAVAIENARLYEQAQSLAALQERQKLARELHDSVSQALYGIGLGTHTVLELLERNGTAVPAEELRTPLAYTLSLAKTALAEMRALIFELRPESLEVAGLTPALKRLADALQARYQIDVETVAAYEPELPVAAKEALYRVAQEALNNVAKHAGASRVELSLLAGEAAVTLEVRDDGVGFDPGGHFPGHLGLQSMRERVEALGGSLNVTSQPGAGTTVSARIPHRKSL